MQRAVLVVLILGIAACSKPVSKEEQWLTDFEKSGGLETPRYDKTIEYIKRLERASPWVRLMYFGVTPQGRRLPMVVVDKSEHFAAGPWKDRAKPVILIQAGIHAGEIDGKDAGLLLLRDMVIHGKYPEILNDVTILFMPIFNLDGHERMSEYNRINQNGPKEMGWRVTAQNLNLNRDYMKADSPEMRAWLKIFHQWRPDFFIDCHVTDGADYRHVVTYAMDMTINVAEPLRTWQQEKYLPALQAAMSEAGFPLSPYVFPVDDKYFEKGLYGGNAPPRFSTEYAAINDRPGLLIETHMYKDYKTRVQGTYQTLLHTLRIVAKDKGSLKEALIKSDELTLNLAGQAIPVTFQLDGTSTKFPFLGLNYRFMKSEYSGDTIVVWEDVPIDYNLPVFNSMSAKDTAVVPYAYVIPQEWTDVISVLEAHGVQMQKLDRDRMVKIQAYHFSQPKWAERPFEGRLRVEFQTTMESEEREFRKGDIVIRNNQDVNRVVAQLLEPKGEDSFLSWGFFNSIFEQKEYGEAYKLHWLADSMMKDPDTRRAFDEKLKNDPEFAKNAYGRLNWFYRRSPYWDQGVNRYPVGRVMSEQDL